MALRKTSIAIPFTGGVETKLDPKQVPPAKLLRLENAVFRRDSTAIDGNGTNAICKRNGYEDLPHGLDATRALGVRGDELLLFTDDKCHSYSEARQSWDDAGAVVSATMTDRVVAKTGQEQTSPDTVVAAGIRFVVWVQGGSVWWTAIDDATGRVLARPTLLTAGHSPSMRAVGEVVHIYWRSSTDLWCSVLSPTNLTPTAPEQLTDAMPAGGGYGVASYGDAAFIAWSIGTGVVVAYVTTAGEIGGPGSGYPGAVSSTAFPSTGSVAVAILETQGFVAFETSPTEGATLFLNLSDFDDLFVEDTGLPGTVTASHLSGDEAHLAASKPGVTPRDSVVQSRSIDPDDITIYPDIRGLGLASNAATVDGNAYAWTCHDVESFSVYLLVRLSDGLVIARYLPTGAAHGLPESNVLGSLTVEGTTLVWAATYNETAEIAAEPGEPPTFTETGIRVVTVDLGSTQSHQSGQLGGCLYLGGAVVSQYDGERWAEAGFHYAPDETVAVKSTGGGLTESTSYLYAVGYEDINAQGEIDRGPVQYFAVALGAGQTKVTLQLPTYRVTRRRNVRIGVWRSPSNDPAALYRVSSLNPSTITGDNRFVPNDATVDTLEFVDVMADADILDNEPLYTNGGIPSNDPVAGGSTLVVGKGRIFTTDPADPLLVRYSQPLQDGYGAEFVPRLSIKLPPFGGVVSGLGVLDANLIVFKRDAVFGVAGDGPLVDPDANPQVGFSEPQLITSDAGCLYGDSIATCPVGLVFQSRKGIYLLGRDTQLQYVGAPVEAYNNQRITRATLAPDRTHVLFLVEDGSTLLWDYFFQQWSTFTNHEGQDAAVVDGRYHYLRSRDGRVFRETPGVFKDANSHIRRTIETSWIKFTGALQGFQRVYHAHVIGRYVSPHSLRVRARFDYEDAWSRLWNIDVMSDRVVPNYGDGEYGAGVYGGTPSTRYQERIHVGQKGQAISFQLQDVEGTDDYGGAFELSELLITGGTKGPAVKVGNARSS